MPGYVCPSVTHACVPFCHACLAGFHSQCALLSRMPGLARFWGEYGSMLSLCEQSVFFHSGELFFKIIIIIIKGHSLRRACLQPATNTQNLKPRPPTTNARSLGPGECIHSFIYIYTYIHIYMYMYAAGRLATGARLETGQLVLDLLSVALQRS